MTIIFITHISKKLVYLEVLFIESIYIFVLICEVRILFIYRLLFIIAVICCYIKYYDSNNHLY